MTKARYRWHNSYGTMTEYDHDFGGADPLRSIIRWNRLFNPRYRYTLAHGVYRFWPLVWLRVRMQEVLDVASSLSTHRGRRRSHRVSLHRSESGAAKRPAARPDSQR